MKNLSILFFTLLLAGCAAFTSKSAQDYLAKSEMYYKTGNLKASWKEAQKALKKEPSAISAYGIMGSILYDQGNYDQAIKYFEVLYKAGDRRSETLSALGAAYASKGDFEKASAYINEALKLNPSNLAALTTKGGIYYSLKDYQNALDIYTKALEILPSPVIYNARAAVYLQMGETDLALQDYKSAGVSTEIIAGED